ncbi:MAG: hypothetical protein K2G22_00075, partial [Eubacterium sp.]|nr:hypothetical protein [Eubacterium sp.]
MANKNKEKKNTNIVRNILFILIAVIVIAAIAVMFFKGSFGNTEKETQSSTDSTSIITNANGTDSDNPDNYTDDSLTDNTSDSRETKTTEKSTAQPYTPAKDYS